MKDFIHFLREKEQRQELIVLTTLFLLLGILVPVFYPYPFTTADSGAYLLKASADLFNIYRPQGYSGYLQILHAFQESLSFVYAVTYILTAIGILFLLFSAKYLFGIRRKIIFYPLCIASVFSPRILFCCNFLMSDGLFHLLTLFFLATALWIPFSRSKSLPVIHLIIFICLYQVRYSGMFYLPVTLLVFLFSPVVRTRRAKTLLILAPIVCFLCLYSIGKKEYHRQTGVNISSGFSGWQLLNNAAVLFPEAKQLPQSSFREPNVRALHSFMQNCPDSLFSADHSMQTNYMWWKNLPLKQFLFYYLQHSGQSYTAGWVYTGSLYQQYARELILAYPLRYITRFIFPSFISMFRFQPFSEEAIPLQLDPYGAAYYHTDTESHPHAYRIFSSLNPVRRVMNAIYWFLLAAGLLYYFICHIRKKYFRDPRWQAGFALMIFIPVYIAISCLASPNTTWRYTLPVYIPSLIFMAYTINQIIEKGKIGKNLLFPRKK